MIDGKWAVVQFACLCLLFLQNKNGFFFAERDQPQFYSYVPAQVLGNISSVISVAYDFCYD